MVSQLKDKLNTRLIPLSTEIPPAKILPDQLLFLQLNPILHPNCPLIFPFWYVDKEAAQSDLACLLHNQLAQLELNSNVKGIQSASLVFGGSAWLLHWFIENLTGKYEIYLPTVLTVNEFTNDTKQSFGAQTSNKKSGT